MSTNRMDFTLWENGEREEETLFFASEEQFKTGLQTQREKTQRIVIFLRVVYKCTPQPQQKLHHVSSPPFLTQPGRYLS